MSADGLRVGLEGLLELWRRRERNTRALNPGDVEFRLMANEIKQCIMELEGELAALLHAPTPVAPRCPLCPVELSEVPPICERCAKRLASALLPPDELEALLAVPPPVPETPHVRTCPFDGNLEPCPHHSAHGITPKSCGCCALGPCLEHRVTSPSAPLPVSESVALDPAPVATDTPPPDHT